MNAQPIGTRLAHWGEGPIWHEDRLLWVDIEGHFVEIFYPDDSKERQLSMGERVGTVVPREKGGLVIAGDTGFVFVDEETGERQAIADPEPDNKPDNRFNDGKCDPAGRFWAGTISTVKKEGAAALYMLDHDLQVHQKLTGITNSNGIVWTKDKQTMYYIDTPTKKVQAFDFDNTTGEITNGRVAIDTASLEGSPDGMAIDEQDQLWIAFCRGSAVLCLDPKTSKILERVDLPVSGATACAFGGPNRDQLFITTGKFPNVDETLAGSLFLAAPGISGPASFAFGA